MSELVYGGTLKENQNHMVEYADELEPVDDEMIAYVKGRLEDCKTPSQLITLLQQLADQDIAIVGSRGFVYSPEALILYLVNGFEYHSCFFPRTLGLRDKFKEVCLSYEEWMKKAEKEDE